MGLRHPNPRRAKIHFSYSVDDLVRLFGVHKNTVRSWFKHGLNVIDGQRPTMARGEEVRRFLAERRARAKQPCGPGRIYCLPCRAPKVPALKMADCVATADNLSTLRGICPDCGRMMYRRVNPLKLDAVRGDLDVTFAKAEARIAEKGKPTVYCDSSDGGYR